MLHAILFNKAGRNIASKEVHWRKLFTTSEDSLTSTIFGLLSYLPVELFWHILNRACFAEHVTSDDPKVLSIEYWPHWYPDDTGNTNLIEPDVFIRTKDIDLIIEAKRYDYNQQSAEQWRKEFQGYLNEYGSANKKVVLIALGGISSEHPEKIEIASKSIQILKCRWIGILEQVKSASRELKKNKGLLNSNDSTLNILNDLILGFGIHGYSTGNWFEDEDFHNLIPINSGIIHLQFDSKYSNTCND